MAIQDSEESIFTHALMQALNSLAIAAAPPQIDAMRRHYRLMLERNRTMNLTRITQPEAAAIKHYADSLALLAWPPSRSFQAIRALDVGTGAGFPAVPLAVMRGDWNITAIDSTRKKAEFVREVAESLPLTNLRVEHARAEHWQPTQPFDLVVVRAVASLDRVLLKTVHLLNSAGGLVLYCAQDSPQDKSTRVARVLNRSRLEPGERFAYHLRCGDELLRRELWEFRRAP